MHLLVYIYSVQNYKAILMFTTLFLPLFMFTTIKKIFLRFALYIARIVHREMQNRLMALQYRCGDELANDGLSRWNTKTVLP